ncbi:hypothetical protein HAV22_05385 [Massilia sp. TW-1]|uniref:Uncharacterized protein n=1 Tax=Telluria antibiotica TaxID=2717319 RepID=A0ABX0P8B6_9BURK|nr:hypothetical protein [Telluria antibiotica]NIA53087.1 hypothetical protein [Telluria antibiotica]
MDKARSRQGQHDANALWSTKKSEAHRFGKHDGNDDANARRSGLQTSVQVQTQALLDFSLVYRKDETWMTHPKRRTCPARIENMSLVSCPGHQNHPETGSAVENVLHIHSSKCAEQPIFCRTSFLSNIGSASIQCLSSQSGRT